MQNGLALAERLAPTTVLFRARVNQPSLDCGHRKAVGNLPIVHCQRTSGFSQWALHRAPRSAKSCRECLVRRWMEQLQRAWGACHSCSHLRLGALRARLPCSRPSRFHSDRGPSGCQHGGGRPQTGVLQQLGDVSLLQANCPNRNRAANLVHSPALPRPRCRPSRRLPLQWAPRPSEQLRAVIPFTLALPSTLLHLHLRPPSTQRPPPRARQLVLSFCALPLPLETLTASG